MVDIPVGKSEELRKLVISKDHVTRWKLEVLLMVKIIL